MTLADTADLWWKNAVVYCLDVATFADSDGDGIGDFGGLIERMDYLAGLGITCLWLMPFYPTANRDDGYDVSEHYGIDPVLGSLGDFTDFVLTAHDRGIRVIADLVVNHTSDQHPWFQHARMSRESRFRDFYVWSDDPPEGHGAEVVFPGEQEGIWSFDAAAGQYYLHRFYRHQPDLNVGSPAVRREIRKMVGFWMAQGLSGFRVDAVPFFIETMGLDHDVDFVPHDYLRDLRAFISRRNGHAALLGEVNLPYDAQLAFFGDEDGDELDMLFDFVGMQATYLALARSDATPIVEALEGRPDIPDEAAFASFLRNHDELTLDKLTDGERQEVFEAFGPDEDMQIFGRGLRRRLPPMFGGDQQRIRMAYSLMFSMPGTPSLFYGEEIGMGENLAVEGRSSVRTPMQWTAGPSGGFSSAPSDALVRPMPIDGYGPEAVNVEQQRGDPESLLNWMERLIRLRRESPEVGWGRWERLDVGDGSVLALRYQWEGRQLITLHNLASRRSDVAVPVDAVALRPVLGGGGRLSVSDGVSRIRLKAYGYLWLRPEQA